MFFLYCNNNKKHCYSLESDQLQKKHFLFKLYQRQKMIFFAQII